MECLWALGLGRLSGVQPSLPLGPACLHRVMEGLRWEGQWPACGKMGRLGHCLRTRWLRAGTAWGGKWREQRDGVFPLIKREMYSPPTWFLSVCLWSAHHYSCSLPADPHSAARLVGVTAAMGRLQGKEPQPSIEWPCHPSGAGWVWAWHCPPDPPRWPLLHRAGFPPHRPRRPLHQQAGNQAGAGAKLMIMAAGRPPTAQAQASVPVTAAGGSAAHTKGAGRGRT